MASAIVLEGLSVLDNPGWHALNTNHALFAVGTGFAKQYPPDMSAYTAVIDHSGAALFDLNYLVSKGQSIRLIERREPPEIWGWRTDRTFKIDQMVSDQPVEEPDGGAQILNLTQADVPDMLRLVELSRPGLFFPRTIEMGHYVGIRDNGRLVAMAGERLYLTLYREISAICTDPDYRGKGYARLLTSHLVNENWRRGDIPFLTVLPDNKSAIRLYESLHFHKRAELNVSVLTREA